MATLSQQKLNDSIVEIKSKWSNTHTEAVCDREGSQTEITFLYSKIIGRGSFGVDLKITDSNNRTYALKRAFQDKRYYNRELDLLLNISHDHVAEMRFYFFNEECPNGKFLNILMDFHPINLEDQIAKMVHVDHKTICKYFYQMLQALDYLHQNKICHRDIKPSNILLDENDNIKLCDFGSAKVIEDSTSNVSYICSRYYRSPENLLGREDYDLKIDIWSLGCVIAELRTFTPLFKGKTCGEVLAKIRKIMKITESDYLELGWRKTVNQKALGVKNYLSTVFQGEDVLDLLEKALVVSPSKRFSAKDILKSKIFKDFKT